MFESYPYCGRADKRSIVVAIFSPVLRALILRHCATKTEILDTDNDLHAKSWQIPNSTPPSTHTTSNNTRPVGRAFDCQGLKMHTKDGFE
jgi:hypothetical protein